MSAEAQFRMCWCPTSEGLRGLTALLCGVLVAGLKRHQLTFGVRREITND